MIKRKSNKTVLTENQDICEIQKHINAGSWQESNI